MPCPPCAADFIVKWPAGHFFEPQNDFRRSLPLFDFELAKDGVPADVNLMPVVFDAAQLSLVRPAQVTQRRHAVNERDDIVFAWRRTSMAAKIISSSCTMTLFDFQELVFIHRPELFRAGDLEKWLNCFQHSTWLSIWLMSWLSPLAFMGTGQLAPATARFGEQENNGAAAQLAAVTRRLA